MAHACMTVRSPPSLKHMNVRRYRRSLERTLWELGAPSKLETFALIEYLLGQPQSTRDVTFNEFVLEYLADDPAPLANLGK